MLKKGCLLVVLLAFFLPLASAQANELFDYHGLTLDLLITNNFKVMPTSADYFIDFVSAKLTWYPKEDYRQEIEFITTEPEAAFKDDEGFLFEWDKPAQNDFFIEQKSRINTKSDFVYVQEKVDFPLIDLDPSYSAYLVPRDIIDITEEIKQKASELVQGEDDLYSAVFKIARWVEQNVEYNLSTITSEANQKASWVLENKRGVCDEITSIFIAMCRSLGIPARFVTGISYSNINLQNDGWGPHGWAEVYFPGFGWVPFDVTYKEFGYIDATHIKLKTTFDAKEVSIDYSTKSRNTDITPGHLDFEVDIASEDYKTGPMIEMKAEVAEKEVGFGSYDLLTLTVKNRFGYYLTTKLQLANVNELEILSENPQVVLLMPREERKIYWIVKINPNLDRDFMYTFPLNVKANHNEKAEISIKSASRFKVYSEFYARALMVPDSKLNKPYSDNVIIICSLDRTSIYINETINAKCLLENKGDFTLGNLKICFDTSCSSTKVAVGGNGTYEYNKNFSTLGVKTLVFKAENELVEKAYYLTVDIKDVPLVEIMNLSFPSSISYEDSSEIKFIVKRKSNTEPRNMKISIEHKLLSEEWHVPIMDKDYGFTVLLKGEGLNLNKNDFRIRVVYNDEQGKEYSSEENFSIMLNNPNLFQKLMIWLRMLEKKASGWFSNI